MLLFLAGVAAAATQADIELVRPTFSPDAIPGTDAPTLGPAGSLRVGASLQYVRDPLLLYKFSEEIGAVVSNRSTLLLGFSWQPSRRVALRAALPIAGQWGGEIDTLSADGVGVGNFSGGVKIGAYDRGPLTMAVTGDLFLPTCGATGWMGDASIRFDTALLTGLELGPLQVLAELGVALRPPLDTGYDFNLTSELAGSGGLRYNVWPSRVAIQTALIGRGSFPTLFQGEAENPLEWVAGVELNPVRSWQVNLDLGRGLTAGYGTSQIRAMATATWILTPPPVIEVAKNTVAISAIPDDLTEVEIAPEPEPVEVPLARIVAQEIVIRDPIQFEFGTDNILPISQPTLEAINKILDEHPDIVSVVIEGHASEEGSFAYNYDLSLRRSIAIFRALVEVGVHPTRLSCRGMGEVDPKTAATDEVSLAENRRVIFHIVKQLEPGTPWPDYGAEMKVPWSGDRRPVKVKPPPPPPPAPKAPARKVKEAEKDDPDQFREEEEPAPTPTEPPPTEPPPAEPTPAEPTPATPPPPAPSDSPPPEAP